MESERYSHLIFFFLFFGTIFHLPHFYTLCCQHSLIPIRIAAVPDAVLDVVICEPLLPVAPNPLSIPTSANRSYNGFRNLTRRLDADDGHDFPEDQEDLDSDYGALFDSNVFEDDDIVVLPVASTTATRTSTSAPLHSSRLLGSDVAIRSHATRTNANITTSNNNNTDTSNGAAATPDRASLSLHPPSPPARITTAHNVNSTATINSTRPPSPSDNAYLSTFADDYDYGNDDGYDDDDEGWEVSMTDWVNNVGDLNAISSPGNIPLRPGPSTQTQPVDQPRHIVGAVNTTASTTTHRSAASLLFAQQYPQQQVRPSVPAILDTQRRHSTTPWNNNNTTTMINNFNHINNTYGTPFAHRAATVTATILPTTVASARPVQPRPTTATTGTNANTTNVATPTSLAAALVAALDAQSSQQLELTSGDNLQDRRNTPHVVTGSNVPRQYSWTNHAFTYTCNTPQFRRTTIAATSTTGSQVLPTRPVQQSQQRRQVRRLTIEDTSGNWSNAYPINASTSLRHYNWRNNHHDCAGLSTSRASARAGNSSIRPHGAHHGVVNTTLPNTDAINTNTSPNWTLWRNGRRYPTPAAIPEAQRIFYPPTDVTNDRRRLLSSSSTPSLTTRMTASPIINTDVSPSASSSVPSAPATDVAIANYVPSTATLTATPTLTTACATTATATDVATTTTATTTTATPPSPSLSHSPTVAASLSTDNAISSAESGHSECRW